MSSSDAAMRSGSKVHWFEVKPNDLAIYLVMQTVQKELEVRPMG